MRAINNTDPWTEVLKLLCTQLGIQQLSTTAVKPYKIAAGTNRNTKLSLIGDSASGFTGHIEIEYSRLELNRMLNKYGNVNKIPSMSMFANPGSTVALSAILDQLNQRFDLKLTMTGNFPDLEPQTFTTPAKGAYVDVTLTPKVGPVTGIAPFSLRIATSNPATVRIYNNGARLSDMTFQRNLNPLKKADANLNWNLDTRAVAAPNASPEVLLYNLDFSDVLGIGAPGGILADRTYKTIATTGCFIFKDEILASINSKLQSVGLPALKNTQPQVKSMATLANWNLYTAAHSLANLIGDTSNGYNSRACINGVAKPYYGAYYDMYAHAGSIKPKHLNSAKFSNVFRILRPDLTDTQIQYCSDVPDAVTNGLNYFWYLHYNIL